MEFKDKGSVAGKENRSYGKCESGLFEMREKKEEQELGYEDSKSPSSNP